MTSRRASVSADGCSARLFVKSQSAPSSSSSAASVGLLFLTGDSELSELQSLISTCFRASTKAAADVKSRTERCLFVMTGIMGEGIVGREGCSGASENALTIRESECCLLVQVRHFRDMRGLSELVDGNV
jgi:hypothetical protein